MKSAQSTAGWSFERSVTVAALLGVFVLGVALGRVLPRDTVTQQTRADSSAEVASARSSPDRNWDWEARANTPRAASTASSKAAGSGPATPAKDSLFMPPEYASAGQATPGKDLITQTLGNPLLGRILGKSMPTSTAQAEADFRKRMHERSQKQIRERAFRQPTAEDNKAPWGANDDQSFEAWWNAPDVEEPPSEEDRAFEAWWNSDDS